MSRSELLAGGMRYFVEVLGWKREQVLMLAVISNDCTEGDLVRALERLGADWQGAQRAAMELTDRARLWVEAA